MFSPPCRAAQFHRASLEKEITRVRVLAAVYAFAPMFSSILLGILGQKAIPPTPSVAAGQNVIKRATRTIGDDLSTQNGKQYFT